MLSLDSADNLDQQVWFGDWISEMHTINDWDIQSLFAEGREDDAVAVLLGIVDNFLASLKGVLPSEHEQTLHARLLAEIVEGM
jgi:hypothetical protein